MCDCGTEVAHALRSNLGETPERLEVWSTRSITMFDRLVLDARLVPLDEDDPSGLPRFGLPERARRRLASHKKALRGTKKKPGSVIDFLPVVPELGQSRGPWTLSLPAHLIAHCPDRRGCHKWEIDTAADSD